MHPTLLREPFHRDSGVYKEIDGRRIVRLLLLITGVLVFTSEALGCMVQAFDELRLDTVRGMVHVVALPDAPIAGATVEVRTTSGALSRQRTRPVAVTKTARDGTFKFERLAPGDYVITIEAPTYPPASISLTVSPPARRGTTPQEAVVGLSRGNGLCSTVRQRERK